MRRKFKKKSTAQPGRADFKLMRRDSKAPLPMRIQNGFLVYDAPPDSPQVTSQRVRELESEMDMEAVKGAGFKNSR
jgi:hypothetical protein